MTLIKQVEIPEGQSGNWRIERFTVTEDEARFESMRSMFGSGRRIRAGTYTRLMRGGTVVMSDTPMEMSDHYSFVLAAKGSVLINGLGIGMCLKAVLDKPEVTDVTVIEASEDVINLVSSSYNDPRVTIIHSCAYEYQPIKGKRFNAVWHDIWDYITSDNLEGMKKLHRKYGKRSDWQGSWCRGECERQR